MSDLDNLVQDFTPESGVFFLGVKPLNVRSVAAARGSRDRVLPVVGRHLYRDTGTSTCWAGGSIDPSRTRLNFSLLPDVPMSSSAMVAMALDAAADHGIHWSRLRKDQIVGVELVISLPVGFPGDARAFFADSLAWVQVTFPQPVKLVAAVVHRDEAAEHMHIILVPLTEPGSMNGHQVIGFKGVYAKRVNSFHEQVGQQHGLGKPRRKAKLTYQERQQVAERVLLKMVTDGAAWADNPAAVAAMRKMLTADPVPIAQALSLMHVAAGGNVGKTAYAVVGEVEAEAAGVTSAYLCNAVDPDLVGEDLVGDDDAGGVGPCAAAVVAAQPDHQDAGGVLADEAWLVLPAWQLAATGSTSTAPQPATSAPIHLVLVGRTSPPADNDGNGNGDGDGDNGDFVRERDDLIPVEYYDCELGKFVQPGTIGKAMP